jgi:hypothetical protein
MHSVGAEAVACNGEAFYVECQYARMFVYIIPRTYACEWCKYIGSILSLSLSLSIYIYKYICVHMHKKHKKHKKHKHTHPGIHIYAHARKKHTYFGHKYRTDYGLGSGVEGLGAVWPHVGARRRCQVPHTREDAGSCCVYVCLSIYVYIAVHEYTCISTHV